MASFLMSLNSLIYLEVVDKSSECLNTLCHVFQCCKLGIVNNFSKKKKKYSGMVPTAFLELVNICADPRLILAHKSHKHQTWYCAFSRTLITIIHLPVIHWQIQRYRNKKRKEDWSHRHIFSTGDIKTSQEKGKKMSKEGCFCLGIQIWFKESYCLSIVLKC